MAASGCKTPTQFAQRLDLGQWGAQKVKRWLEGENEPEYEATIALLELAGWLNVGGGQPAGVISQLTADVQALRAFVRDVAGALERLGLDEPERDQQQRQARRKSA